MSVIHASGRASKTEPPPRLNPPTPALAAYMVALESYQQRRTVEGGAALFRSYRRWIRSFLDDEVEADRAANNFLIALRNQPREPQKMGVAA